MTSSIFSLKTSVNELSSANNGTSRLSYDQVAPTRDVTSGNFPNGSIYLKWTVSGEKWWIPSRSYLRMRAVLTRGDNTQFTVSDGVAPSMNLMANLFQNAELRINEKTVSRVPNYLSQIEALEQRMTKSKSQLDGLYASTNFMQADFSERQAQICSDGNILAPGASTKSSTPIIGLADSAGVVLVNADTLAYVTATGVVTFAGAALADVSQIFRVNDTIKLSGANSGVYLEILEVISATQLQCRTRASAADIAPTALNNVDILGNLLRSTSDERNIKDFELCWTPCLSLFKIDHAMPSGNYCLVLNPFPASVYQLQAIESRNPLNFTESVANPGANPVAGDGNRVRFNVIDMYLYINTVDGPRADNMSYLLDLNETSCQQETVKNASFAQKTYDVSPSTYALTVAFQDGRCNNDTRVSSSLFKCFDDAYVPNKELALNRLYVAYSGINRPSPDADPSFKTGVDRTVQRYVDSLIENGSYFDNGGAESIQDFHKRGSYYYQIFSRDGTDRSTRVSVHSGMDEALFPAATNKNANCLLFAHSKAVAKITVQDGMTTSVEIENA